MLFPLGVFTRANSVKRLLAISLVPVALFALDFVESPILIDTAVETTAAHLEKILSKDAVSLGRFRGHHVFVSADDIIDPKYLAYLRERPSALIVSAFVNQRADDEKGISGALVEAVLSKLQRV